MNKTLVILVAGLTPQLIGSRTPHLARFAREGSMRPLSTVMPAVASSVQSTLVTGLLPAEHGIVANGWYCRDAAEIRLWRQSSRLVKGEKIWEAGKAKNLDFTCANMFWGHNMYSSADWSATPCPQELADGRRISDHYTSPAELHDELDAAFGRFPLSKWWGPMASISSSRWIAKSTLYVMETRDPTLTMTYLPHLDYNLQRLGPDISHPRIQQDLQEVDALCGELIEAAKQQNRRIIVLSEYGTTPAADAIHINRALRQAGLLAVRVEKDVEQLDPGASGVFAVADHQIAHVYIKDKARIPEVKTLLESLEGMETVWDEKGKKAQGLDHANSGELVAIAKANRWFSYYYWLDDKRAPDYARTVDTHRKPGYDPVELFVDPAIKIPDLAAGWRLVKRKLGMRQLMDIISLKDTQLVKGTHGRLIDDPNGGPLVISSEADLLPQGPVDATDFKALTLAHLFGKETQVKKDVLRRHLNKRSA
ncbi:alkaline phosphatase family protein [Pistricoccus aurantiacus]|uniref:Alkaline phosphatase family protein n=1 Tax=Pistricoccus aurantiacus TaxID=1883414 RepID=A0A5B8SP67_9GAMM|nr:nucleotide pyrophosphatase/phosphodiesterase family protein [Pistricoccus aurantiacus]QEA38879.1 alkaline phosphatase family protein [Pistricoccus aurantiacus]